VSILSLTLIVKTTHSLALEIVDAASQEILDQASYYREESPGSHIEAQWDHAVSQAIRSLLSMPERGAHCNFQSPELREMRWIPIPGFPRHLVFYLFLAEDRVVRIVHILHGARDLEAFFDGNSE
jgi:plasmid stabilization system protein ParE